MNNEAIDESIVSEQPKAKINIQRMYLKHIILNMPGAPSSFKETNSGLQTKVELQDIAHWLEDEIYEVVLSLKVQGIMNEKTIYTTQVDYAVIAQMEGFTPEQRERVMQTYFLSMLYPFAIERVNNILTSGSLPGIQWTPVNFEQLYQQKKEKRQSSSTYQVEGNTMVQ